MTKRNQKDSFTFVTNSINCIKDELTEIGKLPVKVYVLYGNTQMNLYDFIKLKVGNIVELEQFFDEPLELYVNGKVIARGELEKSEKGWGIRITTVKTKIKRLSALGKEPYGKHRK